MSLDTLTSLYHDNEWTEDKAMSRSKRRRHAHILCCCGTGRPPFFSGNREGRKRILWCFTSSQKLEIAFPYVITTYQLQRLVYMRRWVYSAVLSGAGLRKSRRVEKTDDTNESGVGDLTSKKRSAARLRTTWQASTTHTQVLITELPSKQLQRTKFLFVKAKYSKWFHPLGHDCNFP